MQIDLDRHGLISLVVSVLPYYSYSDLSVLIQEKKVREIGNQHNEDFKWDETYIHSLTNEQLCSLYWEGREKQFKNNNLV